MIVHYMFVDAGTGLGLFPTPCGVADASKDAVTTVDSKVTCPACREFVRMWRERDYALRKPRGRR